MSFLRDGIRALVVCPVRFIANLKHLLFKPSLRWYLLVTTIIGLSSFILFITSAYYFREDLAELIVSDTYATSQGIVSWILFLVNVFLSGIAALLLISIVGSFFLEQIVIEILTARGLSSGTDDPSWAKSLVRGVVDDLWRLVYVSLIVLLGFVSGLFPLLVFVPIVAGAFLLGFDLLDLPLKLCEKPFKTRWRIAREHWLELIILGGYFSVTLLVPILGVLLLPVAYLVAIDFIVYWEKGLTTSK